MNVLEALDKVRNSKWVDEDGEHLPVDFLPGLTESDLDGLEARIGATLPLDYRTLALACGGIQGDMSIELDLSRFEEDFWIAEIVPHGMPFAHDGCGNFWVVDCLSEREDESRIFYACHDAPVMIFQGVGLASFLEALPAYEWGERDSAIWRVWDDAVRNVWENNPGLISQEEGMVADDPDIRAFARDIGEPCWIDDLRDAPVGAGFSWGRYGFDTRLRRFGEKRIFAYAPRKQTRGVLRPLVGNG